MQVHDFYRLDSAQMLPQLGGFWSDEALLQDRTFSVKRTKQGHVCCSIILSSTGKFDESEEIPLAWAADKTSPYEMYNFVNVDGCRCVKMLENFHLPFIRRDCWNWRTIWGNSSVHEHWPKRFGSVRVVKQFCKTKHEQAVKTSNLIWRVGFASVRCWNGNLQLVLKRSQHQVTGVGKIWLLVELV